MEQSKENDKQKTMEVTASDFEQSGEEFLEFVREIQLKAEKNGLTEDKLNMILYGKSS